MCLSCGNAATQYTEGGSHDQQLCRYEVCSTTWLGLASQPARPGQVLLSSASQRDTGSQGSQRACAPPPVYEVGLAHIGQRAKWQDGRESEREERERRARQRKWGRQTVRSRKNGQEQGVRSLQSNYGPLPPSCLFILSDPWIAPALLMSRPVLGSLAWPGLTKAPKTTPALSSLYRAYRLHRQS